MELQEDSATLEIVDVYGPPPSKHRSRQLQEQEYRRKETSEEITLSSRHSLLVAAKVSMKKRITVTRKRACFFLTSRQLVFTSRLMKDIVLPLCPLICFDNMEVGFSWKVLRTVEKLSLPLRLGLKFRAQWNVGYYFSILYSVL